MAHVIIKANQTHNLSFVSQRTRKASSIIQYEFKVLRIRGPMVKVPVPVLRLKNQEANRINPGPGTKAKTRNTDVLGRKKKKNWMFQFK